MANDNDTHRVGACGEKGGAEPRPYETDYPFHYFHTPRSHL